MTTKQLRGYHMATGTDERLKERSPEIIEMPRRHTMCDPSSMRPYDLVREISPTVRITSLRLVLNIRSKIQTRPALSSPSCLVTAKPALERGQWPRQTLAAKAPAITSQLSIA
jgi:hypothetical protein